MKTKFKATIRAACKSFGGAVCAGAILLIAFGAQAANLFVGSGSFIYEITTGGVKSTFASGLSNNVWGLAFNSAGNLFASDLSGHIYEFTTNGTKSTFASGLNNPAGLAFNSAGNLFEADYGSANIYEFTPSGVKSTFASGWGAYALAFNAAGYLFDGTAYNVNPDVFEFTPGGVQSTFASGFADPPDALAFNSAGILFVSDQ